MACLVRTETRTGTGGANYKHSTRLRFGELGKGWSYTHTSLPITYHNCQLTGWNSCSTSKHHHHLLQHHYFQPTLFFFFNHHRLANNLDLANSGSLWFSILSSSRKIQSRRESWSDTTTLSTGVVTLGTLILTPLTIP